jgi:hypothetical protein
MMKTSLDLLRPEALNTTHQPVAQVAQVAQVGTFLQETKSRVFIYSVYFIFIYFYLYTYDRPFITKQIWLVSLIGLLEMLHKHNKKNLFILLTSYLGLLLFNDTIYQFIYLNLVTRELAMKMYYFHEDHLLNFQAIYLYLIVHLSVFSLVTRRKEPSLKILWLPIPVYLASLYIGFEATSIMLNSLSFLIISMAYARERFDPFSITSHKELLLLILYMAYSLCVLAEFLDLSIDYSNMFIIYTVILSLAVPVFYLDRIKAHNIFFSKKLKIILSFLILGGIIFDTAVVFKTQHIIVSVLFIMLALGITSYRIKEGNFSDLLSGKR